MAQEKYHRTYGIAQYKAHWVGKSLLVKLTASGVLPCANYCAQLEKRPERFDPPNFDMIFYVQDVCQKALRPFAVEATFPNLNGSKSVTVYDALGEHEVLIEFDFGQTDTDSFGAIECCAENDEFIVYGRLPKPDNGHQGCIVVPADNFVPAIYYPAFGPASRADCDEFALKHCTPAIPFLAGDVPFPRADA